MRTVECTIDNLESIDGRRPEVVGTPYVIDAGAERAVAFNGRGDGLLLGVNPLAGLDAFTLEVEFRPDADGPSEQNFFHVQEDGTENRVLLELRMPAPNEWHADTFIRSGRRSTALNDPKATHPAGERHTLALVCTGSYMTQYVDGVAELGWRIVFRPQGDGMTSIGMRINRACWFKGAVRRARITSAAADVFIATAGPPSAYRSVSRSVSGRSHT